MPLSFVVCHGMTSRAVVRQGRVAIGKSQYSRRERYLFALEGIRIAAAVPPLVMPADKKLHPARHSFFCRFLFTDHGMPLQIEKLIRREPAILVDIIAIHNDLADIVHQRSLLHKKTVVGGEIELLSDRIR